MPVEKLVEGYRLDAGSNTYTLPPRRGGSRFKYVQVMVKKVAQSGTTPVGVSIEHGPDGNLWTDHTTNTPSSMTEDLRVVDGDTDVMLGEYFRVELSTGTGSTWVVVDIYLITKPF